MAVFFILFICITMHSELDSIEQQYQGYKQTPTLWLESAIMGISQLTLPNNSIDSYIKTLPKNLRLGKRVEQFVFNELEQNDAVSILVENIQIQELKQTIGELDAIITLNNEPIHLEIVYKFYVYDDSVGISETDHFIGPNRKDSLVEKLTKLKNKQLPLLYKPQTKTLLANLKLDVSKIQQKVCFKAQLFLPYKKEIMLKELNPDCIVGIYLRKEHVATFETCSFYFPSKPDWLIQPHHAVNWIDYEASQEDLNRIYIEKNSACCWIKQADDSIIKSFIVWW